MAYLCHTVGSTYAGTQLDVWNFAKNIHGPNEPTNKWEMDPWSMNETLNGVLTLAPYDTTFQKNGGHWIIAGPQPIGGLTTVDDLNSAIVNTIDWFEVPPAVLINGGKYWTTVVGYARDQTTSKLASFFIYDPRTSVGTGVQWGVQPKPVGITQWNTDVAYLGNPVNPQSFNWPNKYVAVVDPRVSIEEIEYEPAKVRADGSRLISSDEAEDFARQIIEDQELLVSDRVAEGLSGLRVQSHLVEVLDDSDRFYYLVRFQEEGGDLVVVAVDAFLGRFMEGMAYDEPVAHFGPSREAIPELLAAGVPVRPTMEGIRESYFDDALRGSARTGDLLDFMRHVELELERFAAYNRIHVRPEELVVHPLMTFDPCVDGVSYIHPSFAAMTPKRAIHIRSLDGWAYVPKACPLILGH
jgi:hypothetical protein